LPIQLELQGHSRCQEVKLPFLTPEDVNTYLALEFPGHHFPERLAKVVHETTEGNALFVVDLLRLLKWQGVLAGEERGWEVTRSLGDLVRELPESIRSLIQRTIEQLDESSRRLVLAASVQGKEFHSAVVAQVLGRAADDVEDQLQELERNHALVRFVGEEE